MADNQTSQPVTSTSLLKFIQTEKARLSHKDSLSIDEALKSP